MRSSHAFGEQERDGESEEEGEAPDQAHEGLSPMPFRQPGQPVLRGHGGRFPTWILAVEVVVHEVHVLELEVVQFLLLCSESEMFEIDQVDSRMTCQWF